MTATGRYAAVVRALMCLRVNLGADGFRARGGIGDWNRFSGNTIGAYLGLVPSESSSGVSRSQGAITKTGNTHARRLLVEAAWHHRRPYSNASRDMRACWDLADEASRIRGCTGSGNSSKPGTNAGSPRTSPSPANWPAGAGPGRPPFSGSIRGRMNRRAVPAGPGGLAAWRRPATRLWATGTITR